MSEKNAIEQDKYYNNGHNIGLIMALYELARNIKKWELLKKMICLFLLLVDLNLFGLKP